MEDKTHSENKNYVSLTHYIPGRAHEQPVGGWRFTHDHTFCMGRSVDQMIPVKDAGLEEVAERLIEEAKTVDKMFNA